MTTVGLSSNQAEIDRISRVALDWRGEHSFLVYLIGIFNII
jgi:hypothetical protein